MTHKSTSPCAACVFGGGTAVTVSSAAGSTTETTGVNRDGATRAMR